MISANFVEQRNLNVQSTMSHLVMHNFTRHFFCTLQKMKTYVKQNISCLGNETNYSTFHRARKNKVSMNHMHCFPLFFIHDKSKSSGSITLLPVKFSRLQSNFRQ